MNLYVQYLNILRIFFKFIYTLVSAAFCMRKKKKPPTSKNAKNKKEALDRIEVIPIKSDTARLPAFLNVPEATKLAV